MPHPPRPIRAFRLPARRAPSFGQAAAAEAVLDRDLILHLGALPLLLPLLDRRVRVVGGCCGRQGMAFLPLGYPAGPAG